MSRSAPDIVVIDTETGGLVPEVHSLLSLGVVVLDSGSLAVRTEREWYVREPVFFIDEDARRINQITDEKLLKEGLPCRQVWDELLDFLRTNAERTRDRKYTLCGHNLPFDLGFIRRLAVQAGIAPSFVDAQVGLEELFGHRHLDTCALARGLQLAGLLPEFISDGASEPELFSCSLANLGRWFHHREQTHGALDDARLTAKVLVDLVRTAQEGL